MTMRHIVIIGNGISGITAARNIRKKSNDTLTVISSETNYFFSRTALMYVYMGQMSFQNIQPYENWFWKKNRIVLIEDNVESINTKDKTLQLKKHQNISYDVLIIASGSTSNKFGWPGQQLKGVQGLYHKQDLESMVIQSQKTKHAVIVGGGLIGIEMAEMLHHRNIKITMLVRESGYWNNILPREESEMINRLIHNHHIDLQLNTELKEICDDGHGTVCKVITNYQQEIPCQWVGLAVGVHPNIGFIQNSDIELDKGVLVNEYLQTNIPDIYAIGDCAQHRIPPYERKPIEQVWYTGRIMGETVAKTICGTPTLYEPGTWFNSAKFFDVEYQTYGWVWSTVKDHEDHFFWQHPSGIKSIRLVFDKTSASILGVLSMGIRLRHEILDSWISEKKSKAYVMDHLSQAMFDPEFYPDYKSRILTEYHQI